ncbi:39S ribosomal protein L11, mitochondrial isoform X2 [Copidosoma floridanum]|uniref:39S ribosomal protein L11, mitochondrial isoform X2 n=1 Tax=Copidosoma floridanum TaxID=29053 RepID=UPI0006C9706B|nr:39S ribosomal protein L11, mitochondrial isoform X2 [Copidosoma floridanum]
MASSSSRMKFAKKAAEKVIHPPFLKTNIAAGMANPSPPLGPQLGQRNLNVAAFIKDFNEKTAHLKEGIPIPCRIKINPDRSYQLIMHKPPATYYLKQAAGIQKGKMKLGTARTVGIEVVRHLDSEEYKQFLEERKLVVEQNLKELQEVKEAKMLRTA